MSREYWAVRVHFYESDDDGVLRLAEHWFLEFDAGDVPQYTKDASKRFRFEASEFAHNCRDGIAKLDATLEPKVVRVRLRRAE